MIELLATMFLAACVDAPALDGLHFKPAGAAQWCVPGPVPANDLFIDVLTLDRSEALGILPAGHNTFEISAPAGEGYKVRLTDTHNGLSTTSELFLYHPANGSECRVQSRDFVWFRWSFITGWSDGLDFARFREAWNSC